MPEALAWFASRPAAWLVTYLFHSTLALTAVWLLVEMGVVRDPRARDVLWKVALVAGILSASVGVARPAPRPELPTAAQRFLREIPAGERALFFQGADGVVHVEARVSRRPRLGWAAGIGGLWFVGALLAMGAGVRCRLLFRAGVGPLRRADARAIAALARIADGRGRSWRVAESPHADSPCVLRGTIVLPERCAREMRDGELEAVLAHEAAHLLRRDPLWLEVMDLVSRVLWIQPLNRLARRGFLEAAELACDDWAVSRTQRPLDLARSISRVAEWSRGAPPAPAAALAGSRSGLSGRVRRILRGEPGARWGRHVGIGLAVVVLGSALTLPTVRVGGAVEAVILRREQASWVPDDATGGPRLMHVRVVRVSKP